MASKVARGVKLVQRYTVPEIDYTRQKSISYSQLQLYSRCPHAWALSYIQGHKIYRPTIHTVFGTAFHETVQYWVTVIYEQSAARANEIDLEEYLFTRMTETYKAEKQKNNNEHFTTPQQLGEFLEDGIQILRYLKKNRAAYFWKKGWHLAGIEVPVVLTPLESYPDVLYKGYLDVVLYHEPTQEYHILDIKTSTRGWNEQTKKDEMKQNQLILYKEYFSRQFNVPQDKIFIKFLITKRKLWEHSEFTQRRVQEFSPGSGPIKTKKALMHVSNFIEKCFTPDGNYTDVHQPKQPSADNCKFCEFKDSPHLCDQKI